MGKLYWRDADVLERLSRERWTSVRTIAAWVSTSRYRLVNPGSLYAARKTVLRLEKAGLIEVRRGPRGGLWKAFVRQKAGKEEAR